MKPKNFPGRKRARKNGGRRNADPTVADMTFRVGAAARRSAAVRTEQQQIYNVLQRGGSRQRGVS